MYLNIPTINAKAKLSQLTEKLYSADIIHDLVKDATGDEELAEEAYTNWANSRPGDYKTPVNLDTINLASALGQLFTKNMSNGAEF